MKFTGIRAFTPYTPTPEDLERVKAMSCTDCPRRYCWWWRTLRFDWDTPVAAGCTFLTAQKPPGWKHADLACKRVDPTSPTDHFEPREPPLLEDGIPREFFHRS